MQIDRGTLLELLLKAEIEWHGVHAEPDGDKTLWKGDIETFFKLVAEHEREACAKVCDALEEMHVEGFVRRRSTNRDCAAAIRARGNHGQT